MTSVLEHHQQMVLVQDIREVAEKLADRIGDAITDAIKADGIKLNYSHYMNVDEIVHGDKLSVNKAEVQRLVGRVAKLHEALDSINRNWDHETTSSAPCKLPNSAHDPNSCRTCIAFHALKENE